MCTTIVYPAGAQPVSGWKTFLSVSNASLVEVFQGKRDRLPSLVFKREPGTHDWWCHPGKGKHQMCAGLFTVEQVEYSITHQPAYAYIHVSDPSF